MYGGGTGIALKYEVGEGKVREMFDPEQRQHWALTYGQDHLMSSLVLTSQALALLGYRVKAMLLQSKGGCP